MTLIQLIPINPTTSLFITEFNIITNELTYRLSDTPKLERKDIITISGDGMISVPGYKFSTSYLNKYITENGTNN